MDSLVDSPRVAGEDGKAFQNHMLMERFEMVVEFLNQKLGPSWAKGAELERPQELLDVLRDGVTLCRMVGVKPKIAEDGAEVDNLLQFRKACSKLGLADSAVFSVNDIIKPSSLSCICVVNCLQEIRLKLLEMDKALLNEHYCSPNRAGSGRKSVRNSPITLTGTPRGNALLRKGSASSFGSSSLARSAVSAAATGGELGSPMTASKGLLDLLPGQQAPPGFQLSTPRSIMNEDALLQAPATPPTPPVRGSGSRHKASRRVSINTLNAQASIARVQERMASTYKDRAKQLEAGNKELMESVEDLQQTIANLQRSKHEYQLDCEKLQDRNRLLLTNYRVMEAQIMACVEAWQNAKPRVEHLEACKEFESHIHALHETWSDIMEEKTVERGLAGDNASEGAGTISEGDEEDEDEGAAVAPECAEATENKEDIDALCERLEGLKVSAKAGQAVKLASPTAAQSPPRPSADLVKLAEQAEMRSSELLQLREVLLQTKESLAAREEELEQERALREVLQSSVQKELSALRFQFADMSNDFRGALASSANEFAARAKDLQRRVQVHEATHKDLLVRFKKEARRRKELLNTVHNLKGNIRVMCRIRPVLSGDLAKDDAGVAVEPISDERLALAMTARSAAGTETTKFNEFEFDRVFGPTSTQRGVFDEVLPLVESVMDGYHSCIFAYGQTGSGKTFTMSGDGTENPGINFLALQELFDIYEQRKASGTKYSFTVRNVEIYCEKVIDLLASHPDGVVAAPSGADQTPSKSGAGAAAECSDPSGPAYLDIRFNERDGVHMPGCVEVPVHNAAEVDEVMALGARNRSQAHTKMNMASSRSHSVVMVAVHGENPETGKITSGQLVLVDLAGSERLSKSGVEGAQLKEAQSINKSLSCLGDVIAALESKAAHVPFRNSKLTTLLQDSLGKDNKALMILQVSPTTYNAPESLCSLNFAARVRQCELGRARKKERTGDSAKSRAQIKQVTDRAQQLEQRARKLAIELEEARAEQAKIKEAAEREAEKQAKKLQDKFDTVSRSEQSEIKVLREKLQARDRSDNGKLAGLEAELHKAKMEIKNLRQQLRSSIATTTIAMHTSVSPRKALPAVALATRPSPRSRRASLTRPTSGQDEPLENPSGEVRVLGERRASLDNERPTSADVERTPNKSNASKKQVSWKNTPQVIALSARKPDEAEDRENEDADLDGSDEDASSKARRRPVAPTTTTVAPTPSVAAATAASKARRAATAASTVRGRTMGSAARVLQTPGRKQPVRSTARRIPAAANRPRPAWNSAS